MFVRIIDKIKTIAENERSYVAGNTLYKVACKINKMTKCEVEY